MKEKKVKPEPPVRKLEVPVSLSLPKGATYRSKDLSFKVNATPIDYFQLLPKRFEGEGITFDKRELPLTGKLELEHLSFMDYDQKETVVLNVPVGKGKSTLFYKLVERYADNGCIVIVCSPFRKLVDKDYEALKGYRQGVCNYQALEGLSNTSNEFRKLVNCNVHIMSVHCLLRNAGEETFLQAEVKNEYLTRLQERAVAEGKRVILFFDELHETLANFSVERLPALLQWKDVVTKCFVASATFNDASVVAVSLISLLTSNRVIALEVPPVKNHQQANLFLHVTRDPYSATNLSPLSGLKTIIQAREGRKVNILTGSKRLAEALTDRSKANTFYDKDSDDLVESVLSLNPRILTADTGGVFDPLSCNIGTTFKTGVDITKPDTVFVIVLPAIESSYDNKDLKKNYGVFTDGVSSLVQAVGRLRNGGDVHVFLYEPSVVMTGQTPLGIAEWKLKKETAYYPLNKGYDLFASHLAAKSERVPTGIQHLQEQYNIKDIVQDYAFLEGSQPYLLETQPAFGKYLAPYLVWAATNEQFSNATLKGVRYYKERQLKIDLVKDGIPFPDKVVELLAKKTTTPKEQLRLLKQNLASQLAGAMNFEAKKVEGMSLYEAFFNLRACFEYTVHHSIGSSDDPEGDEEVVYRNVFFLDGKRLTYSQFLKSMPVLRAILNLAECIRTGTYTDLTAEEYIRRFLQNELPKATLRQLRSTSLFRTYRELKLDRDSYLWHIQANTRQDTHDTSRMLFRPDIYKSHIFVKNARRMFETLKKLRESDFILNEVFDYAQTLPDTYPTDEEEQVKAAEKVGKRFKELFLVVKGRVHRGKTFLYHVTHYIKGDERVLFLPPEPIDYDRVLLEQYQAYEDDLKNSQAP